MNLEAEAASAMDLVFETFKRKDLVTFYKSASEEVLVSDPSWNADFGNPWASNIEKTVQKQDFPARIWWTKEPSIIKAIDGDENLGIKTFYSIGSVRIQVKQDAFEWLLDAKAFWIKGDRYVKESDWRGVGMLGDVNRYELVLKKDK